MTDRPIIFSAPMVRALLDGRKTQTRRVLKPWPGQQAKWLTSEVLHRAPSCYLATVDGHLGAQMQHPLAGQWSDGVYNDPLSPLTWVRLPYAPGDRLYVREAHYLTDDGEFESVVYAEDYLEAERHIASIFEMREKFGLSESWAKPHLRLRPSIHMPRWASRLTLIVTDVRVQRLQEISNDDALDEGCECDSDGWRDYEHPATQCCGTGRDSFRTLWNSLHGPDAWASSPWVVAISFNVHRGNIDQIGGAV